MKLRRIRNVLIGTAFAFAMAIFLFALLSGAKLGLAGLIGNLPNTAPWALLFALCVTSMRNGILGGSLIIGEALFLSAFFDVLHNNRVVLYIFILPMLLLGGAIVVTDILEKRRA